MDQEWFEMLDVRKRWLKDSVWIPLRSDNVIEKAGRYGCTGYREESYGVGTVAIPLESREEAEKLNWNDIGLNRAHSPSIESDEYTPSDAYTDFSGKFTGLHLVLEQQTNNYENVEWHLHQDFVIALGLKREGHKWICPEEAYVEVARLGHNAEHKPDLLEVKAEYLRDYLCARRMMLRLSSYRSRQEILESSDHIDWKDNPECDDADGDRWEGRITAIHEGGMPFGEKIAVFHAGRTDVDPEEDIPKFDFPTDDNIATKSWTTGSSGRKLFRVEGELWRNEWIDPGESSPRVRGDELPATVYFITDASGKKECQDTLVVGSRWLWFKPDVIMALAHCRGGALGWYTRDTGSVRCSPIYGVHFGVNEIGLVNVYAKDIARLPEWQQRIWAGHNVSPEGRVSEELLASQMEAKPAETQAPESFLRSELTRLDQVSKLVLGGQLFRKHEQHSEISDRCHRFRAVDQAGVFALAKDLTRLITDSIDIHLLRRTVTPPKGENWGSLKLLENILAGIIDPKDARRLLSPLAGIYELRLADAHLKSSEVAEAYKLVGINTSLLPVYQGLQMLRACVSCVHTIADVFARSQASDR